MVPEVTVTIWDVLRAVARRRSIALAGGVVTLLALALVAMHPGVYWAQANVVFLAPTTTQNPNVLQSTSAGLISTAGYVEQMVNAGVVKPATASQVTLLGQGVRDGYSIELPDVGGQWSHNFDRALLNVQVTGPSAAVVRTRLNSLIEKIRTTTRQIQAKDHVSPAGLIRTDVTPAEPRISYATGSRPRALAGTLLLGVGLTVLSVVRIDAWSSRRQPRRAPVATVPHVKESV